MKDDTKILLKDIQQAIEGKGNLHPNGTFNGGKTGRYNGYYLKSDGMSLIDRVKKDVEREKDILLQREARKKELFDMVYQWGRVGVVVDHTAPAYQELVDEIEETWY